MTRHKVPQPAFNVLVGVLLRDRLHCRHEGGCRGHRETESSFQGGWCHVDKHAIGDGLCAGVTKDDLSEKAPGALCFGGFKVAHAILNSAKRRQAFCVPEGWRGQGRARARRNGINLQVVRSYSWAETESSKNS